MGQMTPELYLKLVNQKYELIKVLERATGSRYYIGGSVYCPFHDNTNTPAASIYENDGEQSLWCFSEQKLYKSADAFEILLKRDPYILGKSLWDKMTPTEQEEWLIDNNMQGYSAAESFDIEDDVENTELSKAYKLFKYGKISFKELKEIVVKYH